MSTVLGESAARRRLASLLQREQIPLAEAALALAEEEYPGLASASYLRRLDVLGAEVAARALAPRDPAALLRALREVLHDVHGFRGNADAYYDPRNSFLNEVLDRGLGIPITLSIVYMEVAARAGLPLLGVAYPGHFLVKYVGSGREVFLDPFHGGEIRSAEDCVDRLRAAQPGRHVDAHLLEAVGPRQILGRMLHNLKKIYVELGDDVRALWVTDRLVLVAPEDPAQRRDRGLVEARLGGVDAALVDLQAYLAAAPSGEDAEHIRFLIDQLRGRARLLN